MIATGSPRSLAEAEAQLQEFAAVSEAQHNTLQLVRVLTLRAAALQRQDRMDEALHILGRAVTLASRGDLLFPFVELGTPMVDLLRRLPSAGEFTSRVERFVAGFGVAGPASTSGRVAAGYSPAPKDDPKVAGGGCASLTNRELDVLEFLAKRMRNKEIAARLSISPQTVGSHLKRIYRKLGAHGRRQAVEQAMERGILGRKSEG